MIKWNPFAQSTFDLRFYEMNNVYANQMQGFLISIPESSNTFGFEWIINKLGQQLKLFSHSPLIKYGNECDRPDYQLDSTKIDCISIYPDKCSIFTFKPDLQNIVPRISEIVRDNEMVILQILLQKRSIENWRNELVDLYRDYLSGIETPTSNVVGKFVLKKILELAKKIDPEMSNPRLPEVEEKFNLDGFRYCIRAIIQSETEETRKRLYRDFRYTIRLMNGINKWDMTIEKKHDSFFKMFFNRAFPTLLSSYQILSTKELLPLLTVEEMADETVEEEKLLLTERSTPKEDSVEAKIEVSKFAYMERGKRKNYEVDINLAQKLNNALRKLSLLKDKDVVIQNIQHGATVQKITFSLPEGLKLSDLNKRRNDLQTELALSNIAFEQGELAGTAAMTIPQGERDLIFIRDCAESEEFTEFIKKAELPFIVGVDSVGKVIFEDLTRIVHLLTCGMTGSGKSAFINAVLLILLILKSPRELNFVMIDPKMVELSSYRAFPHVLDVFTDMDDAVGALCYAVETMEDRYSMFEKKGYRKITQYNKNEQEPLPYLVIVIDELADLIMTHPEVEDYIVRIAQKGRASGVLLIIATQKPISDVVTSLLKGNIYSRVCFACDGSTSYRVALDEVPKFTLLGKGDGVCRFEGIPGLQRFQGGLIALDEDKQDEIIKKYSTYWKGNFKKNVIDMTKLRQRAIEKEITDFKRAVLESGETRITELQKMLNKKTERVQELMAALVELGWVVKHKSRQKGYELVLPEELCKTELAKLK
jgi:S-DNA-T family DNA segregation ATPase FtsK/SpoIIIE